MCPGRDRGRGGFLGRPTESPTAPRNATVVAHSNTNPCAPDANLFPASRLPMCKQSRSQLPGSQPHGGGPRAMLEASRPAHPKATTVRGRTRTRPRMANRIAGDAAAVARMDSERAQRRARTRTTRTPNGDAFYAARCRSSCNQGNRERDRRWRDSDERSYGLDQSAVMSEPPSDLTRTMHGVLRTPHARTRTPRLASRTKVHSSRTDSPPSPGIRQWTPIRADVS